MRRRVAVLVVMVMVWTAADLALGRTTESCGGSCKRLDGYGNCRTVYNCQSNQVTGGTALTSIFGPTPCRRNCYRYVRGRCRLKFSCLLG
ncbi:hypothetical protein GWK47_030718 [Chionoecetes opilio]|uniref:Uncharacterized protein n=1 Tax=Chionoecetes opilio TaxID=41210 RepID=A0A8J5D4L7_CHIOP|nr:hypothetical protein GWK47_030718 [Chionoecetes opilio]